MQIDAFVLHLTRAEKRRENALDLLDSCGVAGEIWPAVDGSAMTSADLGLTVGSLLFEPAYPFPLNAGEIGGFLSHRQIWAELQNRDADAALIIEDDAALEPETYALALRLAAENIAGLGYIQLQTRHPEEPAALIDTSGPCKLTVPRRGGQRTTAQMISKTAAAYLLKLSDPFDRPVGAFVQCHWHTGLRPAAIYPSGVTDIADRLDGADIQGGRKPLLERFWREVQRSRFHAAAARLSRSSTAPELGGIGDA